MARIALVAMCAHAPLNAQGVTAAAIGGSVRAANGDNVDGATVRVVNEVTGFAGQVVVRRGAFLIQGLETGGPYRIEVRRLGYEMQRHTGLFLRLGESQRIDFVLAAIPTPLEPASSVAPRTIGVSTLLSDSALHRLPTLNGDLYDFVRIVPQAGTRLGLSGAGESFRFNSYQIDGVSDRALQGNNSPGRSLSLDAIKEYEVLLAPFDARYGDFAGLAVNAVTRAGTNSVHGSAYTYLRDARLARSGSFAGTSDYNRELYGFSFGGPIVRDRAHYFVASEIQRGSSPAPGPYVGGGASVPVGADSVLRFASLLSDRGLDPGDGGRATLPNNNGTVFGRVDVALPELASRLVVRGHYDSQAMSLFARSSGSKVFALTSAAASTSTAQRTVALQLFTQRSSSLSNEFNAATTTNTIGSLPPSAMPQISVTSVGGGSLLAGPGLNFQGSGSRGLATELGDQVVALVSPAHTLGAGVHLEFFRYYVASLRDAWGAWTFRNLDALAAGIASSYTINQDLGSASSPVVGVQPSVYVSDEWRVGEHFSSTLGLRAEGLSFARHPAYNAEVDSIYHRSTSDFPVFRPQWLPRLGFRWESDDDHLTLRGGAGVFAGRPPLGWLVNPMRYDGSGVRTLTCTGQTVPAFTPYPAPQPSTCTNGLGLSNGSVTLIDRHLRMAETFRASLAVDRRLFWGTTGSLEGLYSKPRSDFELVNEKLRGPDGLDSHGRVLYGTFDASGAARPDTILGNTYSDVIDIRNRSGGYSWSATAAVDRPWSDRFEMRASYTYSRTRDVESITNTSVGVPNDIWAAERPTGARLDNAATGISSFDVPHRVVVAGTHTLRWLGQTTNVSLYYVGESGVPFTYGDSSAGPPGMNGDLNADGTAADDPIYVPRNAMNPAEIVFAGADSLSQAASFERFVQHTPCLAGQRGRIMARNSCRTAWVNASNLSVRQTLPFMRAHSPAVQLDVFDVLNLLNASWGRLDSPSPWILKYVGRTQGPAAQPIFSFVQPTQTYQNIESGYQLQLSVRYAF